MVPELILILELVLLLLLHLTLEFLSLLVSHIASKLRILYLRLEYHLTLAILSWVVLQVHHQKVIVWLRDTYIHACHIVKVLLLRVEWLIDLRSFVYHRESGVTLIIFIAIYFLIKFHKLPHRVFLQRMGLNKFEK